MIALTPSERRGALVFALLLTLGALWDLWRAHRPLPAEPPAAGAADRAVPDGSAPAGGTAAEVGPGAAGPPAVPLPPAAPVDLNRATAEELDALPGIGPVLARRILEHRAAHGRFERVEDLLAVRGVGPRLLERVRPWVGVGPAPR